MNTGNVSGMENLLSVTSGSRRAVRGYAERLPGLLLVYGLAYAFFHVMPVFLNVPAWNGFMIADLFDLLTPFVMLGLVLRLWTFLRRQSDRGRGPVRRLLPAILLLVGGIVFVEGHGMHLSANAIVRALAPERHPGAYRLTYLFDEVLGHILWDAGIAVLSVGLMIAGWRVAETPVSPTGVGLTSVGALLYGFTYFVNAVEGQTVVFTLPLAGAVPLIVGIVGVRRRIPMLRNPILWFFAVAYATAVCLFVYWGIREGGFPQFSELRWI